MNVHATVTRAGWCTWWVEVLEPVDDSWLSLSSGPRLVLGTERRAVRVGRRRARRVQRRRQWRSQARTVDP